MLRLTRRTVIKILTSLVLVPVISPSLSSAESELPETVSDKGISLAEFIALSSLLTKVPNLDESIADKVYRLLMSEPWGPENLRRVYGRIRELQQCSGNSNKPVLYKDNFSPDNQWFISHILMTWYTGAYYHEQGNKYVTLNGALMYAVQSDYRQPPTYCSGKSGFWAEPPNAHINRKITTT